MKKVLLFILALLIPWISSMLIGHPIQGVFQLILDIIAFVFVLTTIGAIIGIPIHILNIIWAMILVVVTPLRPKNERERE